MNLSFLCVHSGKTIKRKKKNSIELKQGFWQKADNNGKRYNKELLIVWNNNLDRVKYRIQGMQAESWTAKHGAHGNSLRVQKGKNK